MESLQLAVISVELLFGEFTDVTFCKRPGMCGKFGFVSCCSSNTAEEDDSQRTSANSSRTKRRHRSGSGNNEDLNEGKPASSTEQPVDPSTINVNLVAPHTIKLLTDIREIKGYKQTELDNDELQKALKIHGDILARLENPTKYT